MALAVVSSALWKPSPLQLLEAASAEFYILRVPHRFPTKQYK